MLHETLITSVDSQPMSRTFQYKKIMKPMLERKRRARINHCLDQLKELMVTALQAEGENISKLEKADILELTVQHLHKLRRQQRLASNPVIDSDRFRSGFTHCATEVSKCLATIPGVDIHLGTKLMTHLGHRLNDLDMLTPLSVRVPESASASPAPSSSSSSYSLPPSPPVSTPSSSPTPSTQHLLKVYEKCPTSPEPVWRPW